MRLQTILFSIADEKKEVVLVNSGVSSHEQKNNEYRPDIMPDDDSGSVRNDSGIRRFFEQ